MNDSGKVAPWYRDGLRFSCRGCGGCCRGPGGYVWLTPEELNALAAVVGMEPQGFAARYVRQVHGELALIDNPQGDCILLDDAGRCKAYDARPRQCRTFPWWQEMLESRQRWEQNPHDCPGLDTGARYSAGEIERRLRESAEDEEIT